MGMMIGFQQAYERTLSKLLPLDGEDVDIRQCIDRVLAADVVARIDSPSVDASLKDGYAVIAADIAQASRTHPVFLKLKGVVGAGSESVGGIGSGDTLRILTGARLPVGSDTIVAEEYVKVKDGLIVIDESVEKGFNVLPRGADVASGKQILRKGTRMIAGGIGLAAAAGHNSLRVYRRPRTWLTATGDEVVLPGMPISLGQLYASNISTIDAWCRRYAVGTKVAVVKDDHRALREAVANALPEHDAIITSGGAWKGDRDFMSRVLDELGWKKVFHRIRLGPGKAAGFGILQGKPVFILPGGPASNLAAFLTLVLPALLMLAGWSDPSLPSAQAVLARSVNGQADWTQAVFGNLAVTDGGVQFDPFTNGNRLQSVYQATALLVVPEGTSHLRKGAVVNVLRLD